MDSKTAWQTLRNFAEGRIGHANAGICANVLAPSLRDPDCPVCNALDAVQHAEQEACAAFARRYISDPADPACAADLAIFTAAWHDARAGQYPLRVDASSAPTLYVSPEQTDNVRDPEDAKAGRYLPVRKTPGGKFTQPLYTHPPNAGAPVLDDRWKARMLDGRALERDAQGFGEHPDLPALDEGMHPLKFFESLGLQLTGHYAQDELDMHAYDTMSGSCDPNGCNFNAWTPSRPDGDGWCLVSIHDTEDGPVAWWLRQTPHGAIVRTARRSWERDNLTTEECREYLRDGWTRVRDRAERALVLQISQLLDSQAAPAAVAATASVAELIAQIDRLCNGLEQYRDGTGTWCDADNEELATARALIERAEAPS